MCNIQFQVWLFKKSPLYERGQRLVQCFLQPPALEVFVRRKGLEATIKLSFKVLGKCSQRWVEIFKTYCFDAKSPDRKFRWIPDGIKLVSTSPRSQLKSIGVSSLPMPSSTTDHLEKFCKKSHQNQQKHWQSLTFGRSRLVTFQSCHRLVTVSLMDAIRSINIKSESASSVR